MSKEFPNRPEHPDFWALSHIVRSFDDEALTRPYDQIITEQIDLASVVYMASQRLLRAQDVFKKSGAKPDDMTMLISMYIEGLMVGIRFALRQRLIEGEHREPV